jgi:NAD(P)-dependent dehydrogenase (short-subunit alcohol dehydrogenase family)
MTQRRWLVTGCSSGLGQALAQRIAESGEPILATARNPATLESLHRYQENVATAALDVRDPAQCEAAVRLAVQRFGGIDVLVNNAGYGQFGVTEEVSDEEITAQFDTNVYGPWRLTRLVLPLWRRQGSGHAIFTSSLAGSMALPGLTAYTASKFALEGLAESLAQETAHLGIKVTVLQLGGFSTSYGDKALDPKQRIDAYQPAVAEMQATLRAMRSNPRLSPPSLFAEMVQHVAGLPEPPLRVPLGTGALDYLEAWLTSRRQAFDTAITAGLDH